MTIKQVAAFTHNLPMFQEVESIEARAERIDASILDLTGINIVPVIEEKGFTFDQTDCLVNPIPQEGQLYIKVVIHQGGRNYDVRYVCGTGWEIVYSDTGMAVGIIYAQCNQELPADFDEKFGNGKTKSQFYKLMNHPTPTELISTAIFALAVSPQGKVLDDLRNEYLNRPMLAEIPVER